MVDTSSVYSGSKDSFVDPENDKDVYDADFIVKLNNVLIAMQNALGTDIEGSAADLATRLLIMMNANGAFPGGTTFPTTDLYVGRPFWRTDEDSLYIYDGSSWDSMLFVADGAVSQAKLKTSTGEVSHLTDQANDGVDIKIAEGLGSSQTSYATRVYIINSNNGAGGGFVTLPGGEYGFFPQCKAVSDGANYNTGNLKQRYVTASGPEHWIFILRDISAKKIIGAWQAPDHPSYGTEYDETEMPHPFDVKEGQEVILVDNDILIEAKKRVTSKRSLLTVILDDFELDDNSVPEYEPRELVEIDEYGDKAGEVLGEFKTPDWAKIKIKNDKFYLKKRTIETLPSMVKYKKLKLKNEKSI